MATLRSLRAIPATGQSGRGGVESFVARRYAPRVSIFNYLSPAQIVAWEARDTTNDVTAALQSAHNSEFHVFYPPGRGRVSGPNGVTVRPGQIVSGAAGVPYNQDAFASVVINNTVGGSCFSYTGGTGGGDLPGPTVTGMRLEADNPILFNEVDGQIQNGAGIPSLVRPVITHNYLYRRAAGVGRAISLTRCFDAQVEFNTIVSFSTGILLHGSDLCNVAHNRVQGSTDYSIHEQTALTFGSQNNIHHNDLLAYNSPNLVHIKSCARHVRVHNNYIETTTACRGFIDIGTVDCPSLGSNTLTKCYSVDVTGNRIDGHHLASSFVYRLEPWAVQTRIHDSSTVGPAMSDWTKYFVVVGSYLPLVYDSGARACIYDLSLDSRAGTFSNFSTQDDFDPFSTGLTPRNYARACGNDLQANSAFRHVLTDGESFVVLPTITGNVPDGAYMRFLPAADGTTNPWFTSGATVTMTVTARTDDATGDDIALGVMNGGALIAGTSSTSALGVQWGRYTRTFTAPAANAGPIGLRIASSINAQGRRFIKRISFS